MENCLVTTLKDGITDSNLLKIGEIRAEYAKTGTNSNNIRSVKTQEVSVYSGTGTFVSSGTSSITVSANKDTSLNATENSEAGFEITIPDKYSISTLRLQDYYLKAEQINCLPNLTQLYFDSKTDYDLSFLSNFKGKLFRLILGSTSKAMGDMQYFVDALLTPGDNSIYISFGQACTNIEGDVAMFEPIASSLTGCPLFYNTSMYGDITNILNLTKADLSADYTNTNTILNFDNYKIAPTAAKLYYSRGIVTGDLSKLSSLAYGVHGKVGSKCSWSSETARSSSSYIIGMDYSIDFGDDLDNMLINQAKCQLYPNAQSYIKTIVATGNRTSKSDAAIKTLRAKGITVTVPEAKS